MLYPASEARRHIITETVIHRIGAMVSDQDDRFRKIGDIGKSPTDVIRQRYAGAELLAEYLRWQFAMVDLFTEAVTSMLGIPAYQRKALSYGES